MRRATRSTRPPQDNKPLTFRTRPPFPYNGFPDNAFPDNAFPYNVSVHRLVSLLINSLYSFYWDVVHDWDLGHTKAEHPFLRDQLLFKSKWFYYVAMTVNLLLRFSWSLKLSSHIRIHDDLRSVPPPPPCPAPIPPPRAGAPRAC